MPRLALQNYYTSLTEQVEGCVLKGLVAREGARVLLEQLLVVVAAQPLTLPFLHPSLPSDSHADADAWLERVYVLLPGLHPAVPKKLEIPQKSFCRVREVSRKNLLGE